MKSYHVPCQQKELDLSCFYDDEHFSTCYQFDYKQLTNCFRFDHKITYDYRGRNACENRAQYFQENLDCPRRIIYVYVNHVSMLENVNLVQVDLVYHSMRSSVIIFDRIFLFVINLTIDLYVKLVVVCICLV